MLNGGVAVVDGNVGAGCRSSRHRSANIAGYAQPRLQRLNQAQVRGKTMLVPLSSRLQPGEHP